MSGYIDTDGYMIWVNGSNAVPTNGYWAARITPIGAAGGLVQVTAIPHSDNGGCGSGGGNGINPQSALSINTQATVQPPQGIY